MRLSVHGTPQGRLPVASNKIVYSTSSDLTIGAARVFSKTHGINQSLPVRTIPASSVSNIRRW
ncbi:hypothetical protein B0G76_6394 [Paraburkholderia sp. BL23I1N1]|nr:hypothetical protein B0G76_6394 [Paraburkholderia sp. BL23I1N1]